MRVVIVCSTQPGAPSLLGIGRGGGCGDGRRGRTRRPGRSDFGRSSPPQAPGAVTRGARAAGAAGHRGGWPPHDWPQTEDDSWFWRDSTSRAAVPRPHRGPPDPMSTPSGVGICGEREIVVPNRTLRFRVDQSGVPKPVTFGRAGERGHGLPGPRAKGKDGSWVPLWERSGSSPKLAGGKGAKSPRAGRRRARAGA